METITLNLRAAAREVTHNGRPFLTADATIIVPGVLPGSKGPLLYPDDEVRLSVPTWNGIDIVLYHPTDPLSGRPLSAKSPGVLERSGMGFLTNSRFLRKLMVQTWFDVRNVDRLDGALAPAVRVLPRLRRGEPVELSTGLFTRNDPAPLGAVFNGRPYTHVARAYRPDHLAVLPDQQGACSLRDGCGVLVNSRLELVGVGGPLPDLFGARTHPFRELLTCP